MAVSLILYSTVSMAALDLELTQGVDGAIPIAIVPFANQSGAQTISKIIVNDLRNSGHFRIISEKKFPASPHQVNQVNSADWRKLNVDNLVVGEVNQTEQGYEVNFALVNVYGKHQASMQPTVVMSKKIRFNSSNTRTLAHRISDAIYSQLTGKPGVFSTHIAYILQTEKGKNLRYKLVVADIDGYNPQVLLSSKEPIMSPAWAPDSKNIAYVSFEGHRAGVYLQNVATGKRQIVAKFPGINGAPAWSPDGKQMAVVLSKTGYPKIYLYDLANQTLRQLTDGWAIDTEPTFSPDGEDIYFTSNRGGGPQIYRIPVAGGRIERITYRGGYNVTPRLTSDGETLVILHKENGMFMIAKQDLSSGRLELLTDHRRDQSPSLSPNDEMILFATKMGLRQVLGMVSIDGKIRLRLPAQEGEVREPAWSRA